MRLANRVFFALIVQSFVLAATTVAQDVAITGIKLGMTMQEAESKLPSGFVVVNPKNPPPKGVGIQRFGLPPNYQIEFAVRGDSNEGYTFEAVNGKIAYISRVVYLPKGTEVDYNVYRSQLFQSMALRARRYCGSTSTQIPEDQDRISFIGAGTTLDVKTLDIFPFRDRCSPMGWLGSSSIRKLLAM